MAARRAQRRLRGAPAGSARAARPGDDRQPRRPGVPRGRKRRPEHHAPQRALGAPESRRPHRRRSLPARSAGAARGIRRRVAGGARPSARDRPRPADAHLAAHARLPRPHQALGGVAVGAGGAGRLPAGSRRARARPSLARPGAEGGIRRSLLESGRAAARAPADRAEVRRLPRGRLRACEGPCLPRMPRQRRSARRSGDEAGGAVRRGALHHLPSRPQGGQADPPRQRPHVRRLPPGNRRARPAPGRCASRTSPATTRPFA